MNPSFENVYVNDITLSKEIRHFLTTIAPEKQDIVKYVSPEIPILDHFGVDKQIKSSLGKTVSFKNGAYLIIEHTEAFHVIDVNSGNRTKLGTIRKRMPLKSIWQQPKKWLGNCS